MGDFSTIYKILKYIERSMDYDEFDKEHFTAAHFRVTKARFFYLLQALTDAGYITGVKCMEFAGNEKEIALISPRLTIPGLEYLSESAMMKKAYKAAKGIKDILPGA